MTTTKVSSLMKSFDASLGIGPQRSFVGLLAGVLLALLALTSCGGSESALEPVSLPPASAQTDPTEVVTSESSMETTSTETTPPTEATGFDDPDFAAFAARALDTTTSSLNPMQQYQIADTECQAKVVGVEGEPFEAARHFVITPTGDTVSGFQPESVNQVLRGCYDAADVEITSDQLVELVVNFDAMPGRILPIDETYVNLLRKAETTYQPPTLEREGDDFTFTFLARETEFGDLIRVNAQRTGSNDLTIEYETLWLG